MGHAHFKSWRIISKNPYISNLIQEHNIPMDTGQAHYLNASNCCTHGTVGVRINTHGGDCREPLRIGRCRGMLQDPHGKQPIKAILQL